MKKLLIGSNLKMYKTIHETLTYLEALKALTADLSEDIRLFIIPSYTALDAASKMVMGSHIMLGSQNMCPHEVGQFTGEISPLMLKELNLDIVEIGHSERRHIYGETDIQENEKVISALEHGFIALLCIGETKLQKDCNVSTEALLTQLKVGLKDVPQKYSDRIWIAYEPVWAIGVNGVPADPEYVDMQHASCKKALSQLFPGSDIPVLFGGSVNPQNAKALISKPNIDGLFVGRAAWDAADFHALINDVIPVFKSK